MNVLFPVDEMAPRRDPTAPSCRPAVAGRGGRADRQDMAFLRRRPAPRWLWLVLAILVSAVAVAALLGLQERESDARAKERVARTYAAHVQQSTDELLPLGKELRTRAPDLLPAVLRGAIEEPIAGLADLRPIDPQRTAEIGELLTQMRAGATRQTLQDPDRIRDLSVRATAIATTIADRQRARADRAERQAMAGSIGAFVLALLLVAALLRTERHVSLQAARRHTETIQRLADHDSLTGLPNRRRLDAMLDAMVEGPIATVEIAVCDLNGFKEINDRLGHHAGDSVLVSAAHDLRTAVGDAGTVFRTGGDEFCVISHPGRRIGEAARRALEREHDVALGSVGVARWPQDHPLPSGVMRLADTRMYEVKRATRAPEAT